MGLTTARCTALPVIANSVVVMLCVMARVHIADADKTNLSCLLRVVDVNKS